jgi:hypothetical protein
MLLQAMLGAARQAAAVALAALPLVRLLMPETNPQTGTNHDDRTFAARIDRRLKAVEGERSSARGNLDMTILLGRVRACQKRGRLTTLSVRRLFGLHRAAESYLSPSEVTEDVRTHPLLLGTTGVCCLKLADLLII